MKRAVIVKAVIFDDHGHLLLIRRSKTAPRRPLEWDLPGGSVDNDESYMRACLRELHEETGVETTNGSLSLGYAESDTDSVSRGESYDVSRLFFVAQAKNTNVLLSYEHGAHKWAPLEEAMQLIT